MANQELLDRLNHKKNANNPEIIVKEFIQRMSAWEKKCIEEGHFNSKELEKIFKVFCVNTERNYKKRVGYSIPPEYNSALERIIKVIIKGDRARVFSETTFHFSHFKFFCYILKKTDVGWKIDAKTVILQDDTIVGSIL